MTNSTGWIKLHRKLLDSLIFSSEKGLKVWIWCLLKVSHTESDVFLGNQKVHLQEGQFVFGRDSASEDLNMSPSTVRNWIKILKKDSYLDIKSTNKYSIVTVLKWKDYQDINSKKDNRITTEKQQNNTYNNVKNVKNVITTSNKVIDQYGNKQVNFVLDQFKLQTKSLYLEEEGTARRVAYNIVQLTNTFIKKYGEAYKIKRGQDLTFEYCILRSWEIYRKNNNELMPQRLVTFKQHYKSILYKLQQTLV